MKYCNFNPQLQKRKLHLKMKSYCVEYTYGTVGEFSGTHQWCGKVCWTGCTIPISCHIFIETYHTWYTNAAGVQVVARNAKS